MWCGYSELALSVLAIEEHREKNNPQTVKHTVLTTMYIVSIMQSRQLCVPWVKDRLVCIYSIPSL